jgi:hypothetical protein
MEKVINICAAGDGIRMMEVCAHHCAHARRKPDWVLRKAPRGGRGFLTKGVSCQGPVARREGRSREKGLTLVELGDWLSHNIVSCKRVSN